jgi:hypothetical protein
VSQRQRLVNLGIALVIAVVAVVIIVAASGGSDDSDKAGTSTSTSQPQASGQGQATSTPGEQPDEPPLPEITIKNGKPAGGVTKIRVKEGDRIRFRVVSDVADEVHVHAYDIHKDVAPGKPVTFDFKATITGITEAELEEHGEQIAAIRVDP